ncbi:MAG: MbnH family di-heme enzyme [Thalassotalea sp.]
MRCKLTLFLFTVLTLIISGCDKTPKKPYQWPITEGFPKPHVPENNPMSDDKVALGRVIFYDKNLSFNQQQSCASCHHQAFAFGENVAQSVGTTGQQHRRNAPALVNIAYNKTLTWAHDGITELEQQILLPMFGEEPIELGITGHEKEVLARFTTENYQMLFEQAFPDQDISYSLIVKALASFVRSLISLNSPFDRYAYLNDDSAISASALRGMNLFFSEKLECHHCHGGFNFTQSTSHEKQLLDRRPFHNTGLYNIEYGNGQSGYPKEDSGLNEISLNKKDNGRFRAPTLRNIALSAPYMHDGSIDTLAQVLDFYAAGGRNIASGQHQGDGRINPLKSPFIKGFKMSDEDRSDLIAFLQTLTDKSFIKDKSLAAPAIKK